jgi:hypothetical protein
VKYQQHLENLEHLVVKRLVNLVDLVVKHLVNLVGP